MTIIIQRSNFSEYLQYSGIHHVSCFSELKLIPFYFLSFDGLDSARGMARNATGFLRQSPPTRVLWGKVRGTIPPAKHALSSWRVLGVIPSVLRKLLGPPGSLGLKKNMFDKEGPSQYRVASRSPSCPKGVSLLVPPRFPLPAWETANICHLSSVCFCS